MYEYKAKLVSVVDGDTVRVDVDLGLNIHTYLTLRLAGINAPELGTPEGVAAKAYLVAATGDGSLVIRTVKDRREKYGRYLAHLWHVSEGTFAAFGFVPSVPSINDRMVADGQAVAYV